MEKKLQSFRYDLCAGDFIFRLLVIFNLLIFFAIYSRKFQFSGMSLPFSLGICEGQ